MIEEQKQRPERRMRRLRRSESLRALVRENEVSPAKLIAPIFVTEGKRIVQPIPSMPGVNRYSPDRAAEYASRLDELGISAVLLFGIPGSKDDVGSGAYSPEGPVPSAIKAIKRAAPSVVVIADVCLCEYTSHGHCGVVVDGEVSNDQTLPLLAKSAVQYARAGADVLAPSAMMDGQVAALRKALDGAGYVEKLVMGYSAKYASAFYGPFRDAAGSKPAFGDRRAYQMDPPNAREAMREIETDVEEGADIIMVKPALAYLDVIAKARSRFDLPLAAYSVSGEYAMVEAASSNGWLDGKKVVSELLASIRRAGADMIITYHAEVFAKWQREDV